MVEQAIRANRGVINGYLRVGDVQEEADVLEEEENAALPNDTYSYDETLERSETDIRMEFETENREAGEQPGAGKLYGATVARLVTNDTEQKDARTLSEWDSSVGFTTARPFRFNPYPEYNSHAWKKSGRARYTPCMGLKGMPIEDISAFVGRPKDFPEPSFGSYEALGLDQNLCFERDTRLGVYTLLVEDRDNASWGQLQQECVELNEVRFDMHGPQNMLALSIYGIVTEEDRHDMMGHGETSELVARRHWSHGGERAVGIVESSRPHRRPIWSRSATSVEPRTAILLRSYTEKKYTENDRYNIRALVTELSLRTGGEYQVFLLVHVKEAGVDLWDNETYENYLDTSVPREFRDMTLLWNDAIVQEMYPLLERTNEASVHNAQWLCVQKFAQEFREFSFVWNWEMDSRFIGQAYDMLTKLGAFAKKQPRRELWERNGRFYIPDYHGNYNTNFRRLVSTESGNETVWGAPELPFIRPIGPRPPAGTSPSDDGYKWGVGEEADLVTLSPLFDPRGSGWVLQDQVWSYSDGEHSSDSLPRRASIVTQCRLSRKLLDIMHVENLRGNHVGSEMAPGTVALLHGLKAVYAPMPVFMDRPWSPRQRERWFNGGPQGSSGGPYSAMGWGREGRFRGTTWYYRAEPPQRLYNNWVGYEDGGIGGLEWEMANGRPCLPAMFLHPVKDVVPTSPGYRSESRLPYE